MAPQVKLSYFPLRARGELARALLDVGNIDYVDDVIPFDQWPSRKANFPYGQLPVLSWDGHDIAQSSAICQFIARKAGLAGNTDMQIAMADMVVMATVDLIQDYFKARFCKNEAEKKEQIDEWATKKLPTYLEKTEALLKKHGGQFFTNNGLSIADLAVFLALERMANAAEMKEAGFGERQDEILKAMAKCPTLTAQHRRIANMPRVKRHMETRKAYNL